MSFAQFHIEESARVARAAFQRLMKTGGLERLHVYYKPLRLEIFELDEEIDRTVWTLAFPEYVPGNLDESQLIRWFKERLDRVPYLVKGA